LRLKKISQITAREENLLHSRVISSYQTPSGQRVEILKQCFPSLRKRPVKRVAFVSGLHGNELEGIYICHLLTKYLKELQKSQPEAFLGEIHIYPSVNPQASDSATRLWPFLSIDFNRLFGISGGSSPAIKCAEELISNLKTSADIVVDFHASNLHLKETPQIRITEGFHKKLIPLAVHCNVNLIWVHPSSAMFKSTLGYNMNQSKIPTLVVESGIALRINQSFSNRILLGMLNLLYQVGVLVTKIPPPTVDNPIIAHPSQVIPIHSKHAGLFIGHTDINKNITKGEIMGEVVDAKNGETLQKITATENGFLFTIREHPLVYPGALLGRIAKKIMT
jgi:uncharacterized protein